MKTSNLFLIVLLAVIALAFYTNPNDATHKLAFKTKCKDYLEKKVGNKIPETDDLYLNIGKKLGSILGNSVIDEIIKEKILPKLWRFLVNKSKLGRQRRNCRLRIIRQSNYF